MKRVCPFSILSGMMLAVSLSATAALAQDYGGYRPHYQGYGVNTPGGRGGAVVRVTTLADSGPGSLRAALDHNGPRIVVFEVGGEIQISHPITITSPYVTVAAQTAPSPGITVRGPGLIVDTHDVVLQHLRVRVGAIAGTPHALWIRNDAHNVVVDHVSLSWAVWTSLGIGAGTPGRPTGEVAVIDSLVYESLGCSGVNEVPGYECDPNSYFNGWQYSNSRGVLIGDGWGHPPSKVTWLRSVSANNNDRHPEVGGRTHTFLVNSLIYNPSLTPHAGFLFHDGFGKGPTYSVVAGNVMIPGPTTPYHSGYIPPEYPETGEVTMILIDGSLNNDSRLYLTGNYYEKHCGGTACLASPEAQWMLAWDPKREWEGVNIRASEPPLRLSNLPLSSILPPSQVESYVTANAGARPLDRDVADARVVAEIRSRTGSVPNTPGDKAGAGTGLDGFPILAQTWRPLDVPQHPHEVVDPAGRTRIEWWLEAMARELEAGSGSLPDPGDGSVAESTARFVAVDQSTAGSWRGVYGREGYHIINDVAAFPSHIGVTLDDALTWTWDGAATRSEALQRATDSRRIAATAYSGDRFSIDVRVTDGREHLVSLYTVDWDVRGRRQRVEVSDLATGAVLDARDVRTFEAGQYVRWAVRGDVRLTIINAGSPNAVVSGIFVDPVP